MKNRKPSPKPSLTLHHLLGALSFWGTATRALLFGFVALMVFAISLTEMTNASGVDGQTMILIYVFLSFVLLDFGYVMIARTYPMQRAFDMLALLSADIFLSLLYIVPSLVVNPGARVVVSPLTYVIFVPLVVLCIRMLLGFLFGGKR